MELNLIEILKNVPIGTKLYSTVFGEVSLFDIDADEEYPIKVEVGCAIIRFTKEGVYANFNGECTLFPSKENRDWSTFKVDKKYEVGDYIMDKDTNKVYKISYEYNCEDGAYQMHSIVSEGFYPTSVIDIKDDELDSHYEILEKFPLDSLKSFDRVLVKDDQEDSTWKCALFSHVCKSRLQVCANTEPWDMCVPYNADTKHLVGTTDDAPEFYRQN